MMGNIGEQLLEEMLGEIAALEKEVSRPLLKPAECLKETTGKYLTTRDLDNVGRSLSCRMANRLQTSLPTGSNFWSAEL